MIGTLGRTTFSTSANKIRNLDDFKKQSGGRWAIHEVLNAKPKLQFLGPDLEKITFTMYLSVYLNVHPLNEISVLKKLEESGEAVLLIIGGKPVGENKWVVESLSEGWKTIDNNGKVLIAEVEVSLKEYI